MNHTSIVPEDLTENIEAYRGSRSSPCPVCNKPDWCLSDGASWVLCQRVESCARWGDAGWLHRLGLNGGHLKQRSRPPARLIRMQPRPDHDFGAMAAKFKAAVVEDQLADLAAGLGVPAESLRRLGAGWNHNQRAWAIPMTDAGGRTRGIRLRLRDGRKLSLKGGREGLFIPDALDPHKLLLIAEGPTDTAALLDLGFGAVGRPSCAGGVRLIVELIKVRRPERAVIVADHDEPGRRGAERLVAAVLPYVPSVRVITPPNGIKDARAWKRASATHDDIQAAIKAAPVRRLEISIHSAKV